jgi:cyclic pyranopterin phosphate synthase
MPPQGIEWRQRTEILSFEEIERFAIVAADMGISRIRLTGGEPLARAGVAGLVRRLRAVPGLKSLAMTTNGTLLARMADELVAAGLQGVNVSLVSLDAWAYARITRRGHLGDVLAGIDAAIVAGLQPVKVNVVVARSYEQDLLSFARLAMDRPIHVRFIEYMPIGGEGDCGDAAEGAGVWSRAEHVPSAEILARLAADGASAGLGVLEPVADGSAPQGSGPASYYRFDRAVGTIGVISPLSHNFCERCNRLRLTADGKLRSCLFSDDELDARHVLRHGTDDGLHSLIGAAVAAKPEWHNMRIGTERRMSQIGG